MKKFLPLFLLVFTLAIDLLTKQYFMNLVSRAVMLETGGIEITSFFNLVRVWNYGAAFGLGNKAPFVVLVLTGIVISALIVWMFKNPIYKERLAIAAIIGGALGNFIDRLRFGAVFDFLDFHYGSYHWPAFNVADMAIFCGVAGLLLFSFTAKKKHEETIAS